MADRFPLIIDSAEEKIKELVSGDNLDLTGNSIKNADYIQTAEANIAGIVTATKFKGDGSELDNLPPSGSSLQATASGTLADGDTTIINTDGTVSAVAQVGSGWIATLGNTSSNIYSTNITLDSSGNSYIVGNNGINWNDGLIVAKYNSSGTLQWQRTISDSGYETGYGIAVDSSGNVYVAGSTSTSGAGNVDMLIAKYNSLGTLQWQKTLGDSENNLAKGIGVDSSGNIYVIGDGYVPSTGDYEILVSKLNSSGTTIQWSRQYGESLRDRTNGGTIDSSGNVYAVGYTRNVTTNIYDVILAKWNSSGTLEWQRSLGGSTADTGQQVAVDSSGNVYIVGTDKSSTSNNGADDMLVAKYNSSGTLQWQRILGSSSSDNGTGIAVDSSGNVYACGGATGGVDILIAKWNSSGTIQWQRTLSSTGVDYAEGISVDNLGNIYVAANTNISGYYQFLIAKLPDDGSSTGTYGSFVYASSSLTPDTGGLNPSSPTFNSSSISLTVGSSSANESATSFNSSITNVASTNLTAENFIGISNGAYSDGQTATIQVTGAVDDAQSSLTPGQAYYVQDDGTLGESGSVFAGTAVAATKLIVKG